MNKIKILFDFRSYQESWDRGVGRYVFDLFNELKKIKGVSYKIIISNSLPKYDELKIYDHYVCESENDEIENFDFLFKCNLFDDYSDLEDIFPRKFYNKCICTVAILYDLIPLIFPKNYLSGNPASYLRKFETFSLVDHIFAISDTTANDGIRFLAHPPGSYTTIYGGADLQKWTSLHPDKNYSFLTRNNNLIYVTGADRRKNYQGAARCFAKAYASGKLPSDAKLYLVCRSNDSFVADIKFELREFDENIRNSIVITGFIPDDELRDLLIDAKASIFPSFYEGLGLPILESYLAGTPAFASNISATKEFVSEEASFDPYNDQSFVDTIIRIFNDEDLCKRSLNFGKRLVKQINWFKAAEKTYQKLTELKEGFSKKAGRIAVFSTLPPDDSGIAVYSAKTHMLMPDDYDVFSDFKNLKSYKKCLETGMTNAFPSASLPWAMKFSNYDAKVFVIGNSQHNAPALKEALHTKGEDHRYLYLHEAQIRGAWHGVYPDTDAVRDLGEEFGSKFFVHPLISRSGIRKIFVNNELARELILSDLPKELRNEVKIDVLFLPIEDLRHVKVKKLSHTDDEIIIGSFGLPSPIKGTDVLIEAISNLRSSGLNVRLILAGYHATSYRIENSKNCEFISVYEPDEDELISLMKSVDVAVQLRNHPHGETSGCVSQLLGMQQKIITTEGFVSDKLKGFCSSLVPSNVTAEKLADAIKKTLSSKKREVFEDYSSYSYLALARTLKEKITLGGRPSKFGSNSE